MKATLYILSPLLELRIEFLRFFSIFGLILAIENQKKHDFSLSIFNVAFWLNIAFKKRAATVPGY
jgi:hypothetical protein